MSAAHRDYDVVIVGGGPAGTSAAIHLAMRGAHVLLAEKERFPRAKLCGEFISPECLGHFQKLGLGDQMIAAGGARITETVFYTRKGRSVSVPSEWFGTGAAGGAALGLSRAEMDDRLLARARCAGVEVLEEAQAVGLITAGGRTGGVHLKTKDNGGSAHAVRSLITIDATGRSRALARRLEMNGRTGPHTPKRRASLVAFKAHVAGACGAEGHCEIYFYRGGYGGLSRVENGLSNLCFIAAARDVRAYGGHAEQVMREVVMTNQRAAQTLARARGASEWLAVALESFGRQKLVPARGLLTVGDAASFIDPFTGSGMLMALESGELAAEVIARALSQLRVGDGYETLASNYRARYRERFNARLRVCAGLRRAAFIPRLAETAIFMLSTSERMRRRLAQATRKEGKRKKEKGKSEAETTFN